MRGIFAVLRGLTAILEGRGWPEGMRQAEQQRQLGEPWMSRPRYVGFDYRGLLVQPAALRNALHPSFFHCGDWRLTGLEEDPELIADPADGDVEQVNREVAIGRASSQMWSRDRATVPRGAGVSSARCSVCRIPCAGACSISTEY